MPIQYGWLKAEFKVQGSGLKVYLAELHTAIDATSHRFAKPFGKPASVEMRLQAEAIKNLGYRETA